jgi:hypothetical protein
MLDEDDEGDVDEWHTGDTDFFSMSVRFPRADIPFVLERLERHNQARGFTLR